MRIDEIHPGDVIAGKYRVRTILGRNNGLLLEGFHTEFDQRVVIKILLASQGEDRALERFRREARTLAKLESEHVARIIDVGTEPDGSFYLVRQYLEGVDVSTYLRQNGPLAVPDAVLVVLMVAEAVAETHSHKIIVRELQPGHLFVTQRAGGAPLVKITDFGTAKLMRDAAAPGAGGELTATAMFGLSPYSSPELLRKAKNVDVRTDVWSLGAIFYELLTGRPPFTGETAMLMLQITKEDPTPPSQLRSGINPEIDQIISWALAKDVDARFKNVHAFAQTLLPYAPPEGQVLVDRIRQITEAARRPGGKPRDGAAAAGPAFTGTAAATAPTVAAPAVTGPSPAAQAAQAAQAAHAAQGAQRRPDESPANMRSAQDNLIVSPPPAMQGAQNYGGPPTAPLPIGGGYPNQGPSGPSHGVGPSRPGPGMSAQPVRSGTSSTPTSRKVAMSALAIAAVALPLVVLLVVLRQINQPSQIPTTTPVTTLPTVPETPPTVPSTIPSPPPTPTPPTSTTSTSTGSSTPGEPSANPTTPPIKKTGTGTVRTPPTGGDPGAPNGTLLAVAVGGNCAFSVNGASKGTAPSIRLSVKPGTYTVACKPETGNAMSKSVTVKSDETSMMAFPLPK